MARILPEVIIALVVSEPRFSAKAPTSQQSAHIACVESRTIKRKLKRVTAS